MAFWILSKGRMAEKITFTSHVKKNLFHLNFDDVSWNIKISTMDNHSIAPIFELFVLREVRNSKKS